MSATPEPKARRPHTSGIAEYFKSQVTDQRPDACPWIDTGPRGINLNVEDFPTFILLRLANTARINLTKRYLDQFDLSLPEWRLLALAARFSPLPFGEVASRSSMDKGQVSRTLHRIKRKGMIRITSVKTRTRVHKSTTAPRIVVSVTRKGRALCQKIVPVAREHQMRLLAMLSQQEQQTFYAVARKLQEQLPLLPAELP